MCPGRDQSEIQTKTRIMKKNDCQRLVICNHISQMVTYYSYSATGDNARSMTTDIQLDSGLTTRMTSFRVVRNVVRTTIKGPNNVTICFLVMSQHRYRLIYRKQLWQSEWSELFHRNFWWIKKSGLTNSPSNFGSSISFIYLIDILLSNIDLNSSLPVPHICVSEWGIGYQKEIRLMKPGAECSGWFLITDSALIATIMPGTCSAISLQNK